MRRMSEFGILDGFAPEEDFARDNGGLCRRTLARYRNQPDGLPYARWGGRVYIDVNAARDWLAKRATSRNQRIRGSHR